jgi:uncharacterized protein (DUF2147 family)
MLRTLAGLMSAALFAALPAAGFADDQVTGLWQTTDRNMDYRAEMCGKDANQLCVTLTAARACGLTMKTQQYLGKLIVDHAAPNGRNRWRGTAYYNDWTITGDIVLVPGKSLTFSGCVLLVVCGDFMLIPGAK